MALVTEMFCQGSGGLFQFFITYDDVDRLTRSVRIINNGTIPATIKVYDASGALAGSYVAQPGTDVSTNIPTPQRLNVDQYSISCSTG